METEQEERVFQQWMQIPVGTSVIVRRDDGTDFPTVTRSTPWVLGHGAAVIAVDGIAGGYSLDRVRLAESVNLEGLGKVQPPSVVTEPLSDNKHSATADCPPLAGHIDRRRRVGIPSAIFHVRASRLRPGQLSLGVDADSDTWHGVFEMLSASGFQPGDVVQMRLIRRDGGE